MDLYRKLKKVSFGSIGVACAIIVSGCALTKQAKVDSKSINCVFLGADCAMLSPGGDGQAGYRYVNPNVMWPKYTKVFVAPVTYWAGKDTSVPGDDQVSIVNYFYQSLQTELGKKFQLVSSPQPGAMKIQVALVDVESATPGLRSVSMIIPQIHMLATLKDLVTGSYPFVGAAQAEVMITDSMTGDVLGAAVDRRVGGGAMRAGFQWRWGDAENAADAWSKQMAEKLFNWTSGLGNP